MTAQANANLALRAIVERDTLREYVRRSLGVCRDLQRVLGGHVLEGLIAEGERALDGVSS